MLLDQALDTGNAAIHIATEGPLGHAARRYCLARGLAFTTAYHTRFPQYLKAMFGIPERFTYRFLRYFHGPATAVMAPTPTVERELREHGLANVALWTRGVDLDAFTARKPLFEDARHPVFLYVGRVSVEKNIQAFLALDLPGTKVVAGIGPELETLRKRFPEVRFVGVLDPERLARLYSAADVFVFPSRTDTFGLVMLEALACGTPVAAFPGAGTDRRRRRLGGRGARRGPAQGRAARAAHRSEPVPRLCRALLVARGHGTVHRASAARATHAGRGGTRSARRALTPAPGVSQSKQAPGLENEKGPTPGRPLRLTDLCIRGDEALRQLCSNAPTTSQSARYLASKCTAWRTWALSNAAKPNGYGRIEVA